MKKETTPIWGDAAVEQMQDLLRIQKINEKILWTVDEVSVMLRINKEAVYKLIKSGELKALKLGSLKIRRTEIERFLQEREEMYKLSVDAGTVGQAEMVQRY